MADQRGSGTSIHGTITNNEGNAAIGTEIRQSQLRVDLSGPPTAEELAELAATFAALRAQVEQEAAPEVREEAVRRAEALEEATTGPTPDVSAMDKARRWFLEHAPGLFGAVTTVIVNPIVGKIVSTAGEAIADEYRRRFPEAAAAAD
jgi:hypothetical protein